jgi:hypothetical protein
MKFTIQFMWHRDEAWESIADDFDSTQKILDDLLKENEDAITPRILREIHQKLRDETERKSINILREFLEETDEVDGLLMPRYAQYVRDILDCGIYDNPAIPNLNGNQNPINDLTYKDMIHVRDDKEMFIVDVTIPDEHSMERLTSLRDMLPDTLWEGIPGSTAVYYNGAVITYSAYKK